jgi:hypothetical protein
MPDFTIETTYHLPVFRHRTHSADTLDAACRAAIEDDTWDIAETDFDSSGAIHVTGIWDGAHAAYAGPPIQIPQQFNEPVQRRARHFEILLGLLKILFDDVGAARPRRSIGSLDLPGRLHEEKPFSPETRILKSRSAHQSLPTSWSVFRRIVCAPQSPRCST